MRLASLHESILNVDAFDGHSFMEFGVCTGDSMYETLIYCLSDQKIPKKVFGFDSFEGLPEEATGIKRPPNWFPGAFRLKDHNPRWGGEYTTEAGLNYVKGKLKQFTPYNINIYFIKGWFSDTLNEETILSYRMVPAKFVHIDTDIYISTIEVLEFLVKYNMMADGCIIRYDDWDILKYGIEMHTAGQSLAHKEIVEKHNLQFTKITDNLFKYEHH